MPSINHHYISFRVLPDGVSNVLPSADDNGENNEDASTIEMVHSVVKIVVVANFNICHSPYRPNDTVHPRRQEYNKMEKEH